MCVCVGGHICMCLSAYIYMSVCVCQGLCVYLCACIGYMKTLSYWLFAIEFSAWSFQHQWDMIWHILYVHLFLCVFFYKYTQTPSEVCTTGFVFMKYHTVLYLETWVFFFFDTLKFLNPLSGFSQHPFSFPKVLIKWISLKFLWNLNFDFSSVTVNYYR